MINAFPQKKRRSQGELLPNGTLIQGEFGPTERASRLEFPPQQLVILASPIAIHRISLK
jgi:hypothetical protein